MWRMRRLSAWLLVVPLMLAGTEFAHALAYRLVYPQASVRWQVLAATGHGYMDWVPLVLGVGGALGLAGVLRGVVDTARRRPLRPVPCWAFGLLPILGFTLQEFLERWIPFGGFPWWMVEQPTFRVGVLLQLPFGLIAFVIARTLLRAIERVGAFFSGLSPRLVGFGEARRWRPQTIASLRPSALASGHAGRGPPVTWRAPLLSG